MSLRDAFDPEREPEPNPSIGPAEERIDKPSEDLFQAASEQGPVGPGSAGNEAFEPWNDPGPRLGPALDSEARARLIAELRAANDGRAEHEGRFDDRLPARALKARLLSGQGDSRAEDRQTSQPEALEPDPQDALAAFLAKLPAELVQRIQAPTPVTARLMLAMLLIFFAATLSFGYDENHQLQAWVSEEFWSSMLRDQVFEPFELARLGALQQGSSSPGPESARLLTASFIHNGPFSLILSLLLLNAAGRFVERLGSGTQVLTTFLLGGALGHLTMLLMNERGMGLALPCTAFMGCAALIGAQYPLRRRGLSQDFPLRPSRGFVGACFSTWLVGGLQLGSLDPARLMPVFSGLAVAALCGALMSRSMVAWLDAPAGSAEREASNPGARIFNVLALPIAIILLYFSPAQPGSELPLRGPSTNSASSAPLRRLQDKDLELTLDIPEGWQEINRDKTFVVFGEKLFGVPYRMDLILLTRERQSFDAADALAGRFLNLVATDFNFDPNAIAVLAEGPVAVDSGSAYEIVFELERGNAVITAGTKRSIITVGRERVFILLFLNETGDDARAHSIAKSLRPDEDLPPVNSPESAPEETPQPR